MAKKDNDDGNTTKIKKDKKNIVNFQDYKKKVNTAQSLDQMEESDNLMVLADINKELADMCLTEIFPEGIPKELEGDFSYVLMCLRNDDGGENDNVLSADDLVYEDMDFEEEYEELLADLLETTTMLENEIQEKALMAIQIEKLEEELKILKKKKTPIKKDKEK